MPTIMDDLITAAMQLAGSNDIAHGGRLWRSVGGRGCPLGWGGCSQAVYEDIATGEFDYGKPGGPGHNDCLQHCHNGMEPPPQYDDYALD